MPCRNRQLAVVWTALASDGTEKIALGTGKPGEGDEPASITEGRKADLEVHSGNLYAIGVEDIPDTTVLRTMSRTTSTRPSSSGR